MLLRLIPCLLSLVTAACQDYPFESRQPLSATGQTLAQRVTNPRPTDILFILDNSGSMGSHRAQLQANVAAFIGGLVASDTDFQVAIITTDLECNVPERGAPGTRAGIGIVSDACIRRRDKNPLAFAACSDQDRNGDGRVDYTTCDAGRLRSLPGLPAYFTRPQAADQGTWAANFSAVIGAIGCDGSGYEAGLETARRAVVCSAQGYQAGAAGGCPSQAIADLSRGFVRDGADLVLIFITDEDDCSFRSLATYAPPAASNDAAAQARHLCSEEECYAYYNDAAAPAASGLEPWSDPQHQPAPVFTCSSSLGGPNGAPRQANVPRPDSVSSYLDAFIAAKGGDVSRLRAAAIISGVGALGAATSSTGIFTALPCVASPGGPSASCGCWSATQSPFYCTLTQLLSQAQSRVPIDTPANVCATGASSPGPGGCAAMPGGRYNNFLGQLQVARTVAGVEGTSLAASICQTSYSSTMAAIVDTIILSRCFDLGAAPPRASQIYLERNGVPLSQVQAGSGAAGWSLQSGAHVICLEGGIQKNLGDQFGIFVLNQT